MVVKGSVASTQKASSKGAVRKARGAAAQTQNHDNSAQKTDALKRALAQAFAPDVTRTHTSSTSLPRGSSELGAVDTYGKGAPTDRLQFGYAPAITSEAVAYHASFATSTWVAQRRANWKLIFQQKHKLQRTNCEPITSVLKLRSHWDKLSHFNAELRGSALETRDVDELIDVLASKQRVSKACE